MCPTDFCQPLPCLLCTRAQGSRPAWFHLPEKMARSEDPSFHDALDPIRRAVLTEEGCSPSRAVDVPFRARDPTTLSRSTHDFVSDASSPPGSRLRLHRSARVMSVGSRPLPPPFVKRTACHDPRRLPPALGPSSLERAPRACLATRSGCPSLASPSLWLAPRKGQGASKLPESATLMLTRGHEPCVRARVLSPRRTVVRKRVGRSCPCGRPTRESHVDLRRRTGRASRHAKNAPLYAFSRVSRPRRLSRARSPVPRGEVSAGFRRSAAYVDGARRYFPRRRTVRLATSRPTPKDFTTSDVGRGLRERRTRTRHSLSVSGERVGRPSSRKAPSTLCRRPGCVRGWSGRARLGDANPERPRPPFAPPPAKEMTLAKARVLASFRRSIAGKGHPFLPVDRPPCDASPHGDLPKRRASAGSTDPSRLTLNAWSGG